MNQEELAARNAKRFDSRIFTDKKPKSIDDVKALLREFDPKLSADQSVTLNAEFAEESGPTDIKAIATVKSKRSMLLFGFEKIRYISSIERDEILEEYIVPSPAVNFGLHWPDQYIARWLGATREGLFIVWNLNSGKFKYDIFTHTLTRV